MGTPVYFDFSVFSFHDPTKGLSCAINGADTTAASARAVSSNRIRFMYFLLDFSFGAFFASAVADYVLARP
jgi:hypothetical protein